MAMPRGRLGKERRSVTVYDRRMSARQAAVWSAIDEIAAQTGRTPSALAKASGLDQTAFIKSKRFGDSGLPR